MRILLGSKSIWFESVILYVSSVGLSIIWYGPLRRGCNFLEIPFCVLKLGIRTNVPNFKSGLKRELICSLMFCLCNNYLVTLW